MASNQVLYPTHNIDETSLICNMQLCVRSLANKMCNGYVSDIEDYIQVAYEDIIKTVRRTGRTDTPYLYGVARIAMLKYKKQIEHMASLDAWMDDEVTGVHRDVEDKPYVHHDLPEGMNSYLHRLIGHLEPEERGVIRAFYGLHDSGSRATKKGVSRKWKLSDTRYYSTRDRAVRKLRMIVNTLSVMQGKYTPPSGGAA